MAELTKVIAGETYGFPLKTGGWSQHKAEEDGLLIALDARETQQGGIFIPKADFEGLHSIDRDKAEALCKTIEWVFNQLVDNLVQGTCKKESIVLIEDALEDLKDLRVLLGL
jgi:hypothetical protein